MNSKRIVSTVLIVCVITAALAFAFSGHNKVEEGDLYQLSGNILIPSHEYQNKEGMVKDISLKYDKVKNFSEGLAAVAIGDKWGFINLENNLVIPAIYQEVRNFQNGTATVKLAGKWLLINKFGQEIKTTETI